MYKENHQNYTKFFVFYRIKIRKKTRITYLYGFIDSIYRGFESFSFKLDLNLINLISFEKLFGFDRRIDSTFDGR